MHALGALSRMAHGKVVTDTTAASRCARGIRMPNAPKVTCAARRSRELPRARVHRRSRRQEYKLLDSPQGRGGPLGERLRVRPVQRRQGQRRQPCTESALRPRLPSTSRSARAAEFGLGLGRRRLGRGEQERRHAAIPEGGGSSSIRSRRARTASSFDQIVLSAGCSTRPGTAKNDTTFLTATGRLLFFLPSPLLFRAASAGPRGSLWTPCDSRAPACRRAPRRSGG